MLHPLLTSFPLPIHAPSLPSLCLLTHQTPTPLKIMKLSSFSKLWLFFFIYHSTFDNPCKGDQSYYLKKFLKFQSYSSPQSTADIFENFSPIYTKHQDGSMATDRIDTLPGQPAGVDFVQYAGYITVDPKAETALFYYFVESPQDSASKPLLLWLNGGPGCSSLGYGAMAELGPFRVKSDGKTLIRNDYAWNKVANVLFVESPAGVGFSYSNTSTNNAGDQRTVLESYVFLLNWLKRFPHYKNRDLFITGESYAGHYVPQLAEAILTMNRKSHTRIKLKGIAIGNPVIDHETYFKGIYDYLWSYSLISDETYTAIKKYCDFLPNGSRPWTERCNFYLAAATEESGGLDVANIYGSHCNLSSGQSTCVTGYDPCIDDYVYTYLNLANVQAAFHTKATNWTSCRLFLWTDSPSTVLPIIAKLITSGIRLWIYSGDTDAVVPITSTRYAINKLNLRINSTWRPWNSGKEVGGYVVGYEGLTFVTVKGAGHKVPMIQPERALIMISSFLEGKLPPSSH